MKSWTFELLTKTENHKQWLPLTRGIPERPTDVLGGLKHWTDYAVPLFKHKGLKDLIKFVMANEKRYSKNTDITFTVVSSIYNLHLGLIAQGKANADLLTDEEFEAIPEILSKRVERIEYDNVYDCHSCKTNIGKNLDMEGSTSVASGLIKCPKCGVNNRWVSKFDEIYSKGR